MNFYTRRKLRFFATFCTTLLCGGIFFSANAQSIFIQYTIGLITSLLFLFCVFTSLALHFVVWIAAWRKARLQKTQKLEFPFIQYPYSIRFEHRSWGTLSHWNYYICLPNKRRFAKLINPYVPIGTFYSHYGLSGNYDLIVLDFNTRKLKESFLVEEVKASCRKYERLEGACIKIYPLDQKQTQQKQTQQDKHTCFKLLDVYIIKFLRCRL